MRTTSPRQFLALRASHRNRLRCLYEAVPDFFEELQPIGDAERVNVFTNGAHRRILRFSCCARKPQVSTDNAQDNVRREAPSG